MDVALAVQLWSIQFVQVIADRLIMHSLSLRKRFDTDNLSNSYDNSVQATDFQVILRRIISKNSHQVVYDFLLLNMVSYVSNNLFFLPYYFISNEINSRSYLVVVYINFSQSVFHMYKHLHVLRKLKLVYWTSTVFYLRLDEITLFRSFSSNTSKLKSFQ